MTIEDKLRRMHRSGELDLPLPGGGETATRHRRLTEIARQDLTLARLAEAHTDAVAILAEAGRLPAAGAMYGVWASEIPSEPLRLEPHGEAFRVMGSKEFCSGAGIVDRALVTIRFPEAQLVDVDLRENSGRISYSEGGWISAAFAETRTVTANFGGARISERDKIGPPVWYLNRPGFWHGACGPASCWAGGAMGLVEFAMLHKAENPHTLAHLGAMQAAVWGMNACLDSAGNEIDAYSQDKKAAVIRALALRHVVEQFCVDILQRFGRACGPRPLAFDEAVSRRYQEVQLYIRQCHAERDLEMLGRECVPLIAHSRVA